MIWKRDAGVKAVENLMKKKGRFDYVMLETTGLADPGKIVNGVADSFDCCSTLLDAGPIASMFWLDDELQSSLYLDGIITVVDAKFGLEQLSEKKADGTINEAVRQIALADRIIVNKKDLVSDGDLSRLEDSIRSINAAAPLQRTTRSEIPIEFILDLHCFDDRMEDPFAVPSLPEPNSGQSHHIDETVQTIAFTFTGKVNISRVDEWLQQLLWEGVIPAPQKGDDSSADTQSSPPPEVLRMKALVNVEGSERKWVVQAVREVYDKQEGAPWGKGEERVNKVVFIGEVFRELVL
ncbi:COBW domain-containing protein 1 [Borealophlyctis nickersoniae]|nr:COBW domain-containing protein 1 [Borealophlyctis nickersoniae]